jgi:hypothetical protein
MVVVKNEINDNKNYTSNTSNFEGHAYTVVRCGAHFPMERIRGFVQSH